MASEEYDKERWKCGTPFFCLLSKLTFLSFREKFFMNETSLVTFELSELSHLFGPWRRSILAVLHLCSVVVPAAETGQRKSQWVHTIFYFIGGSNEQLLTIVSQTQLRLTYRFPPCFVRGRQGNTTPSWRRRRLLTRKVTLSRQSSPLHSALPRWIRNDLAHPLGPWSSDHRTYKTRSERF